MMQRKVGVYTLLQTVKVTYSALYSGALKRSPDSVPGWTDRRRLCQVQGLQQCNKIPGCSFRFSEAPCSTFRATFQFWCQITSALSSNQYQIPGLLDNRTVHALSHSQIDTKASPSPRRREFHKVVRPRKPAGNQTALRSAHQR